MDLLLHYRVGIPIHALCHHATYGVSLYLRLYSFARKFTNSLVIPNSFTIVCYTCFPKSKVHVSLCFGPNIVQFAFCVIVYFLILYKFKKDPLLDTVSKHMGGKLFFHFYSASII